MDRAGPLEHSLPVDRRGPGVIEMTTCFECDELVAVDLWDKHQCPTDDDLPGYDPAEPWMDEEEYA